MKKTTLGVLTVCFVLSGFFLSSPVRAETYPQKAHWFSSPSKPQRGLEPRTETAFELGAQFSQYDYKEPDVMTTSGLKYGVEAILTAAIYEGFYARADFRLAFGEVDYKGSGEHDGEFDRLVESRVTVGKDFIFGSFGLVPYLGFGYRNLYNDGRGLTTTGAVGYERESQYFYIPIGLNPRWQLNNGARLSLVAEYDYFLRGLQYSGFSIVAGHDHTLNPQKSGRGFRGELMYEKTSWAIGPFFNYWNIDESEPRECTGGVCLVEPKNHTTEYGLQMRYRFH